MEFALGRGENAPAWLYGAAWDLKRNLGKIGFLEDRRPRSGSGTITEGGPDFVAPAERIAVFDNDGTLWTEQPIYFPVGIRRRPRKRLGPSPRRPWFLQRMTFLRER